MAEHARQGARARVPRGGAAAAEGGGVLPCSFCCTVGRLRERRGEPAASYCHGLPAAAFVQECANCRPQPLNLAVDQRFAVVVKTIFRTMVTDLEAKDIFGATARSVDVAWRGRTLTPQQHEAALAIVAGYRQAWELFVDDALNKNRFRPPSGGAYRELRGTTDWAEVMSTVFSHFVSRFGNEVNAAMGKFLEQTAQQRQALQDFCEHSTIDECDLSLCSVRSPALLGLGRSRCAYVAPF
jgi:hypothetical protein